MHVCVCVCVWLLSPCRSTGRPPHIHTSLTQGWLSCLGFAVADRDDHSGDIPVRLQASGVAGLSQPVAAALGLSPASDPPSASSGSPLMLSSQEVVEMQPPGSGGGGPPRGSASGRLEAQVAVLTRTPGDPVSGGKGQSPLRPA